MRLYLLATTHERMDSAKQNFLGKKAQHFGVVLFFEVGDRRENPMGFCGKANVSAFKRLTHYE